MVILKLILFSVLVNFVFTIQGADVTCSGTACTTSGNCPQVPTTPSGLAWQNGASTGKCAINNCPTNTSSGLVGASDLFCLSCQGTTSSSVKAVYSNTQMTGCVAASATCGSSRTKNTWSDSDCLACNGSSLQYAKSDQSGCAATQKSNILLFSSLILLCLLLI
ncbi:cell surface immobilization antigen (macronuclear) [Tetrahymena thermophila SB210]|uniref:Cell surface immobilization antigen n=1 Tax=Tetrahymena thermophila (strain SB210) TaxID=312017 RepID=I7M993_TETTS|nr:cell surface immobilization antigen [Tetrahymena thermophila SB210]EAS01149.1 cell surface immobilization antigen [Tetrahymena thermophila SB210]|eukprot:XP_001021394.1 cell surface immobilization antigen [Tetrahymena thermophila SB210]